MADNPLLKALPPETDYLSYLTILEYNLIPDQLPTLHHILQDTTLTANIGWDLVHLLLPLLPASQQCLQDVARLGNPREVVLKVTELLEEIAGPDEEDDESGSGSIDESETKAPAPRVNETEGKGRDGEEAAPVSANLSQPSLSPSKVVRFNALLEMLAILHPRIKTKYPSRFLSTSLRTVLPAYLQVSKHVESTEAVLKFINALSGTKRPPLPPRNNSSVISTPANAVSAPDPEDHDEVLDLGEMALQLRLLQSFLTFFVDCFMVTTMLDEDVPGLAWSSRYQEKLNPQKIIPDRRTYNSLFAEDERLHHRDSLIGQTLALARDLKFNAEELLSTIKRSDEDDFGEVEELPSSASEVPLSRTGSVYLLAATAASSVLFDAPASSPRLSLIPDFAAILGGCLGDAATGSTGAEPEPLIDAVLFLGFLTVNARQTISTDSDETFNNILQRLSLLSANIPSPVLRYHAHRLTCTTLHLHTSDHVRLAFIRNTLEHCPFENLKVSAVGWLKDEILAADNVVPDHKELDAEPSIFAKPAALTTLLPFLFPEPSDIMDGQTVPGRFATFQAQQPFHLAVLNLVYLLLSSTTLTARLQMAALTKETLFSKFLEHLLDASRNFQHSISGGELGFGDGEANDAGLAAMKLMEMSVEQVTGACRRLRFWPLPPDGDNGQI